jgi:Ser/Thr protein kinase RdoA (MazF antagonist)
LYVDFEDRVVFDAVLDGVDIVVKVDTEVERHDREVAALRAAAAAGVPVADVVTVLAAGADDELRLLALRRVDGPTLRQRSHDVGSWRAAGAALAQLHRVTPPPVLTGSAEWRDFLAWSCAAERTNAKRLGLDVPVDAIHAELVDVFATLPEPDLALIHGDAQPEHAVLDADGTVAAWLDLGDAMVGDPAWDIAVLVLDDPHRLDAVLDGYQPSAAMLDRVTLTLRPYRMLRYLGEAGWLVDHGFDPSESIAGLTALV